MNIYLKNLSDNVCHINKNDKLLDLLYKIIDNL